MENQSSAYVPLRFFTSARMRNNRKSAPSMCALTSPPLYAISKRIIEISTRRDYHLLLLCYRVSSSFSFSFLRSASVLHADTDDINDPRRITSTCPRTLHRAVLRKATRCIGRISGCSPKRSLTLFLPSCPASVVFLQVSRYNFIESCFTLHAIYLNFVKISMFRKSVFSCAHRISLKIQSL